METFNLWEDEIPFLNEEFQANENNTGTPTITAHIIDEKIRSAVVIFPGGGYNHRAEHEGNRMAEWFNSKGINAFVLNYRVKPYKYPVPVIDAKRALKLVKHNAEKFRINPEKIGVIGFSAGAHLAGITCADINKNEYPPKDNIDKTEVDIFMLTLCYPVVSLCEPYAHKGSGSELLGNNYEKLKSVLSLENNAEKITPPVFIWHTAEDGSVPVQNSLELTQRLISAGNNAELHIFPNGKHGLGLAEETDGTKQWTALYIDWLKRINFYIVEKFA